MKIAFFNYSDVVAGSELWTKYFSKELSKYGYESDLIYICDFWFGYKYSIFNLDIKKILYFLFYKKYEIIHVNNIELIALVLIKKVLNPRTKIILHTHNCKPLNIKYKLYLFLLKIIKANLIYVSLKSASVYNSVNRDIISSYIVPSFSNYYPKISNDTSNKISVFTVGNWRIEKRHELFMNIASACKDLNVKWRIFCSGVPDWANHKIQQLVSAGIDIRFIENESNPFRHINKNDIFLGLSSREGLGLAFIEAQINGNSCLVTDAYPSESFVIKENITILNDVELQYISSKLRIIVSKSYTIDPSNDSFNENLKALKTLANEQIYKYIEIIGTK